MHNFLTTQLEQLYKEFSVTPQIGLNTNEVSAKREKYGFNKLVEKKKKTILQRFLSQLNDWLIYILLAAVAVTLFMGEYLDAGIILAVIIVNAVLGVVQEVKADKAIDALRKLSSPKALVKRNNITSEIPAEELVPGDIIILEAGRQVPADSRLIESVNLKIDEAAFTGESVPVEKNSNFIPNSENIPIGDRLNYAFMSTLVTYGRGTAIVTKIGMDTEFGKIADMLNTEDEPTPLEIRLDELGKVLAKIAIGICLLIFGVSYLQGRDLLEMFMTAVSLAVASIPEGLAAIVAVVLSIGVTNMSKKNAIIKTLPAVETLGSVNIICSDKTGTLTQNKMTVVQYYLNDEEIKEINPNKSSENAKFLAKAMVLSSDATLENEISTGDPTEIALLYFADELNINRKELNQIANRKNEIAFDSDRKLMTTLVEENGKFTIYSKGALSSILNISSHYLDSDGTIKEISQEIKDKYRNAANAMSDVALRTLAVAFKNPENDINDNNFESNLCIIGLVGMIDPPREEVKDSIKTAKTAGITTLMITGDHKNTAFTIGKELGIAENIEQTITGKELDEIPENKLISIIKNLRIFARVSPEHKVKIVKALKGNGNIVSMTGDGVNDAPSLKAADIGVAMGITGTDVSKGASDVILTDDNFSTIVTAIEEGRNIYNNIKKSVIFLLSSNLGEVVAVFVSILLGLPAPLIATQLLWINLITDSLPAIGLGMENGDHDVMKERPRSPNESFFANGAGSKAIAGGTLIGLLTILAYGFGFYEHNYSPFDSNIPNYVLDYARTLAFMTIVFSQLFYSLGLRSFTKPLYVIGFSTNKVLLSSVIIGILLQLLVLYIPFMRDAFKLQALDLYGWLVAAGFGLIPFLTLEIIKIIKYIKNK